MPKKPNFLGGQQNYNKSTGEYEPNLVGPNGKVVTDADGDGISHENKSHLNISKGHKLSLEELDKETKGMFKNREEAHKWLEENKKELGEDGYKNAQSRIERAFPQEHDFNDPSERESAKLKEKEFNSKYDQIFDGDYQRSWGVPSFKDENDTEVLKGIIKKAEELGDDNILENAQERLDELESKQNTSSKKYELVTPETKIDDGDVIIYKELGDYKMTNGRNWKSNIQNAHEIQDLSSFDNPDDIVDYLKRYSKTSQDKNFKVIQDYYHPGSKKRTPEEEEYVKRVTQALKESK